MTRSDSPKLPGLKEPIGAKRSLRSLWLRSGINAIISAFGCILLVVLVGLFLTTASPEKLGTISYWVAVRCLVVVFFVSAIWLSGRRTIASIVFASFISFFAIAPSGLIISEDRFKVFHRAAAHGVLLEYRGGETIFRHDFLDIEVECPGSPYKIHQMIREHPNMYVWVCTNEKLGMTVSLSAMVHTAASESGDLDEYLNGVFMGWNKAGGEGSIAPETIFRKVSSEGNSAEMDCKFGTGFMSMKVIIVEDELSGIHATIVANAASMDLGASQSAVRSLKVSSPLGWRY